VTGRYGMLLLAGTALCFLHNLYFHPVTNSAYRRSGFSRKEPLSHPPTLSDCPLQAEDKLDLQQDLLSSTGAEGPSSHCAIPSAAVFTKACFYMSLTGHWLAIEGRRLARVCRYPLQSTCNDNWIQVFDLWEKGRSLQESFDL
jgi:hypothetical protein